MKAIVSPSCLSGTVNAIASKSVLHRLLLCAALSHGDTRIDRVTMSKDISATMSAAKGLGKDVHFDGGSLYVTDGSASRVINVNESGSTFRFILPVLAATANGKTLTVTGSDYLASRPISPLYEELTAHGAIISEKGKFPMTVGGTLSSGEYHIPGDISSQFISGLLFALPLLDGNSSIVISGKLESKPYVDITVGCLEKFGIEIIEMPNGYFIRGGQRYVSPREVACEGDFSNAAFFLAAGALSEKAVGVTGLPEESAQGDAMAKEILSRFGAVMEQSDETTSFRHGRMTSTDIDATDIPDLIPILALVASVSEGVTHVYGARRLRFKESDRLASVTEVLSALGADIRETEDGLIITGVKKLYGGRVPSHNDHRIAMTAAIAAAVSDGDIEIDGFEAINKSYPDFARDLASVGGKITLIP